MENIDADNPSAITAATDGQPEWRRQLMWLAASLRRAERMAQERDGSIAFPERTFGAWADSAEAAIRDTK